MTGVFEHVLHSHCSALFVELPVLIHKNINPFDSMSSIFIELVCII